jgi:HEAT repeat protein
MGGTDGAALPPDPACDGCRHRALHLEQRCRPGDRCVRAHSGRQIDRFFRLNPESLILMAGDKDPLVRRAATSRMPPLDAETMLNDPDWSVRYEAALRVEAPALRRLVDDEDPDIRDIARSRLKSAGVADAKEEPGKLPESP